MWQCPACEYFNDDWDEACEKCAAVRAAVAVDPSGEPGDATYSVNLPPTEQTDQGNTADQAASDSEAAASDQTVITSTTGLVNSDSAGVTSVSKASLTDRLLVYLILLIAVAIVVSGIIAWRIGLLTKTDGGGSVALQPQPGGGEVNADSTEPEDPDLLPPAKYIKRFAPLLNVLVEMETQLPGLFPDPNTGGTLSAADLEELNKLDELAEVLAESYTGFEQAVVDAGDSGLTEFAENTRERFQQSFEDYLISLGRYRAADLGTVQPVYLQSDQLVAAADAWGYLDTDTLKAGWLTALYNKYQLELDLQYVEIYRQLEARLSAFAEIHSVFNESLKSVDAYKIRSGTLGASARAHLESLDSYAVLVEDLVREFNDYQRTLGDLETSDRLEQLTEQFTTQTQQDHLYCFTECYEIYVRDRQLKHPVYDNLKQRFAFVTEYWTSLEIQYQRIAAKYEADWTRRWHPDVFNK